MRIRPFFWLVFALSCAGVLLLAATVRPHVPVIMQVNLEQHQPFSSEVTTLKLHLTDPQGLPLDGVHIVSSASMTNMDMVTHQESVRAIGSGTYIATLGLSMAGPWAITVTASLDGFDPVQKTLLVEVV
jgi:hypothetical protein